MLSALKVKCFRPRDVDPRVSVVFGMRRFVAIFVAGLVTMSTLWDPATPVAQTSNGSNSWTVYHGDPAGSGVSTAISSVDTSLPAWSSSVLTGEIYGEPLVYGGRVYVATENDVVYAISSTNGSVAWSENLAEPVPSSSLPCGDITPYVGITGTPVIDQSRNEIFVVADEFVDDSPEHFLVGLDATTGAVEIRQDVDPPGAAPSALLQRTGLTLDDDKVVFAMGGNYGDCASYRGRVVAVAETGGTPQFFTVDAAAQDTQGAIWMGGAAPVIDAHGDIWVSVGNGSVFSAADGYDDSDSALELSSSLHLLQYFAPADWPQNNANDLDMSVPPTLLSDGDVVLAGKSRIVYLLDGSHLGGMGSELASLGPVCNDDIDGGSAVLGTTVFLPCLSGVIAVQASSSPPALRSLWSSGTGGGPPIVAAGLVWTIGQNGALYGLDPSTGTIRQEAQIGIPANHFSTPSVGDGLLLAASADRVVAFRTMRAPTKKPVPATTTVSKPTQRSSTTTTSTVAPSTASSGTTRPGSAPSRANERNEGFPAGAVFGIVAGVVILSVAGVVFVRRRRRP
jgi:outer membrane protein assembly factor BamB